MISLVFRVVLILCSLFTAIFIIRKIRQSKVQINYAIFWILFSACLLIFSVFPELSISLASLLGIYSSTNFIFLVILFTVIIKLFFNTIEISNLEYKIKELSQKIAIDEKDFNETKENKSEEEMMKVRNLGRKSLEEVIWKMNSLGFNLHKDDDN